MGWAEAVKGFLIALPQLVGAMKDALARLDGLVAALQDRKAEEIRAAQRQLEIEVSRIQNDEQRADLVRRLALLERRR